MEDTSLVSRIAPWEAARAYTLAVTASLLRTAGRQSLQGRGAFHPLPWEVFK